MPGTGADPTSSATKKQTRRAVWTRRRADAARRDEQERARLGAAVAEHLLPLVERVAPARVCSYESWPAEPPTAEINAALGAAGIEVLVPITLPDLDLDWRPIGSPDDPASGLGPGALDTVDLVLAPATSVDRAGTRLGQGGGCYDRTLPRLRPGTPVVALLFDGELVDDPLPCDPHDQPVDAVVTPSGLVRLR